MIDDEPEFTRIDEGGHTRYVRVERPRLLPSAEEALRRENLELLEQLAQCRREREDLGERMRRLWRALQ